MIRMIYRTGAPLTPAVVVALALSGCAVKRDSGGAGGEGLESLGEVDGSSGATGGPGKPGAQTTQGSGTSQTTDGDSAGGSAGILLDVGNDDGPGAGDGGPLIGCTFINVLFIVDISASMSQEKANLAANFPTFIDVLDTYIANDDNAQGYRVGVTNSSVNGSYDGCDNTSGLDGELFEGSVFSGDCGTNGTPWLDGPAPGLAESFSCLGEQPLAGDNGSSTDCGKERPLDALELFLQKAGPGGANDGFYGGDDALLVVVTLTDEDDDPQWTTTAPAATKAALDDFTGGEERYVIVTIAGPGPGTCESDFGSAVEAEILHEFTELAPNGMFGDICEGDLSLALAQALELIQTSCDELPPPEG